MLAARASSRAYSGVCALAAQREFLRIVEVTDRISEHIMCFLDTESALVDKSVAIVRSDGSMEKRQEHGRERKVTTRKQSACQVQDTQ